MASPQGFSGVGWVTGAFFNTILLSIYSGLAMHLWYIITCVKIAFGLMWIVKTWTWVGSPNLKFPWKNAYCCTFHKIIVHGKQFTVTMTVAELKKPTNTKGLRRKPTLKRVMTLVSLFFFYTMLFWPLCISEEENKCLTVVWTSTLLGPLVPLVLCLSFP